MSEQALWESLLSAAARLAPAPRGWSPTMPQARSRVLTAMLRLKPAQRAPLARRERLSTPQRVDHTPGGTPTHPRPAIMKHHRLLAARCTCRSVFRGLMGCFGQEGGNAEGVWEGWEVGAESGQRAERVAALHSTHTEWGVLWRSRQQGCAGSNLLRPVVICLKPPAVPLKRGAPSRHSWLAGAICHTCSAHMLHSMPCIAILSTLSLVVTRQRRHCSICRPPCRSRSTRAACCRSPAQQQSGGPFGSLITCACHQSTLSDR